MTGRRSIKAHLALRIEETSNFPKDTVGSRRGRSLRVRKQWELMRREREKKQKTLTYYDRKQIGKTAHFVL